LSEALEIGPPARKNAIQSAKSKSFKKEYLKNLFHCNSFIARFSSHLPG